MFKKNPETIDLMAGNDNVAVRTNHWNADKDLYIITSLFS